MRPVLISALLMVATPAFAEKICVVDFQKAVADTNEGKSAQRKLEQMKASRRTELERMQADFEKALKDYQGRAGILSDNAKLEEEQRLAAQQVQLNQAIAGAEAEMQQTYVQLLGDLDTKLRTIAATVGTSNQCSVVLDRVAVVFAGPNVKDVTVPLVTAYNKQYPGQ